MNSKIKKKYLKLIFLYVYIISTKNKNGVSK